MSTAKITALAVRAGAEEINSRVRREDGAGLGGDLRIPFRTG